MKRLVLVVVAVLLSGCGDAAVPSLEQPFQVEISALCGVDWQRFTYEGEVYHLQARNDGETESYPRGWKDPTTVTIIEEDGQLLAIAPDGSERELVPVSDEEAETEPCF